MLEKAAPVRRDFDRMDQIPEMVFRILQMLNFLIILYITLLSCHALSPAFELGHSCVGPFVFGLP